MIYLVDDDHDQLTFLEEALKTDYEVRTFSDASEALKAAKLDRPDLVISDIRMPEMDGFQFYSAYEELYGNRKTPFIFLSSLADDDNVVRGLETGVDGYLTKPISPVVLKARVASVFAGIRKRSTPIFRGDLSLFPFIKVLKFCELNGLSGSVEFQSPGFDATVPFRAGNIVLDDVAESDEYLSRLYELAEGTFTIRSFPVSFSELEDVSVRQQPATVAEPLKHEKPMGMLSGVRAGERLFQIQTELVARPEMQVLSLVILNGNTVLKRTSTPLPSDSREQIEERIKKQHLAVESEVKEKLATLEKKQPGDAESVKERFYKLFDAGFDAYRSGDFEKALSVWGEAKKLNPGDKTLETNLRVARKKLEGDGFRMQQALDKGKKHG